MNVHESSWIFQNINMVLSLTQRLRVEAFWKCRRCSYFNKNIKQTGTVSTRQSLARNLAHTKFTVGVGDLERIDRRVCQW